VVAKAAQYLLGFVVALAVVVSDRCTTVRLKLVEKLTSPLIKWENNSF